jgi:hypothetical protein
MTRTGPTRSSVPLIAAVAATLSIALAHAAPAAADIGFRGPNYSPASAPTGQKPQSKLWHADGIWWASMFNRLTRKHEIFRLSPATRSWSTTSTLLDERQKAATDALWDGSKLYVAAAVDGTTSADSARIRRYSYSSATKRFTLDTGFPVTVTSGGMEAVVLEKDSTGKLWITFTQAGKVHVAHTTSDHRTWTKPFVPPVTGAANLTPDDVSAIVAYRGHIGVMWSNRTDSAMYFAYHRDGTPDSAWSRLPALSGPRVADDHINLKSLQSDGSGTVVAATKTSNTGAGDPLIRVLVLRNGATSFASHVFGRVSDNHTRAQVAIDRTNRQIYVFASAPCCSGGAIYYKRSSLDNVSFSTGLGTPLIQSSTDLNINNPTTTKQEVTPATGLVVLAGDDRTKNYWHNSIALTPGPTTKSVPATADAHVVQSSPNTNFGSSTTLRTDGDAGALNESLFRFVVSGVSGRITSAKLRAYVTNGTGNGPAVYATGGSWTETGLTWNNKPARVGAASDDQGAVPIDTHVEYDVTPLVSGNGTFNFVTVTASTDALDVNSRESTRPPTLELKIEP